MNHSITVPTFDVESRGRGESLRPNEEQQSASQPVPSFRQFELCFFSICCNAKQCEGVKERDNLPWGMSGGRLPT